MDKPETLEQRVAHLERWFKNMIVGYLILLVGIGANYWASQEYTQDARNALERSGNVIAVDSCNRAFKTNKALRTILDRSLARATAEYKAGVITKEAYDASVDFNTMSLADLPLPDCRVAATILSDNPDDVPPLPKPLRP